MTVVNIDVKDLGGIAHHDDRVAFRAPNHRAEGDQVVSTAAHTVMLVDGIGSTNLSPGPAVVRLHCQGVSDNGEKQIVVPEDGPVALAELLEGAFTYTPAVVSRVARDAAAAEDAAVRAEGVADAFGSLEGVEVQVQAASDAALSASGSASAASSSESAAATSESNAAGSATSADSSASAAASSASAAASSASAATEAADNAAGSESQAASSASAAASSASVADSAATRAEDVADSTHWQDDRLSVMGQLGPSLTGPKGDKGDSGAGSGDVLWSELAPALEGKLDLSEVSHLSEPGKIIRRLDNGGIFLSSDPVSEDYAVRRGYIDSALRDKADLVDGKVPADQLPTALLTPTGGEPRTDNAAYLELDEFLSIFDGDVPAAVAALQSDGITQPLIDMGTVDGTGTLITPAAFDTAAGAFLDHVLTHDTGLRPIATMNGTHWNGTNLTPAIRTKIASEALRMVWDYGFSGVQIDFEPYSTQIIDDALIPLLQEIRTTLPAQHSLSVALPTHRSGNITTTQIGQMAQVVDMLNPMIYDTLGPPEWGETTIQTAEEYQQLYRAEIDAYQTGIGAAAGKLVPIVPAYNDLSMPADGGDPGFPDPNSGVIFYHLHEVENISVAMAAVHEAITIDGHAIDSLAVFWYPALYYAGFEADRAVWEGWVNPGGVTSRQITDATTVGRAVLTADDAAAARGAIGAGTSSLGLGSTSDTAAPGNHTHAEYAESSRVTALEGSQPIIVSSLPSTPLPGRIYLVTG